MKLFLYNEQKAKKHTRGKPVIKAKRTLKKPSKLFLLYRATKQNKYNNPINSLLLKGYKLFFKSQIILRGGVFTKRHIPKIGPFRVMKNTKIVNTSKKFLKLNTR